MVSLTKQAKSHAESAISILLANYSADFFTIDGEKMSKVDHKMYIELNK
jgi:hypothetical protein